MTHPDLERACDLCAKLRELIIHRSGGWDDAQARRKLQVYCRGIEAEADDDECRQRTQRLLEQGAALFSPDGHAKFALRSTPGADFLRLQMLREIDALQSRLVAMEAARNASLPGAAGKDKDFRST